MHFFDELDSLNGGIPMCMKALAGILIGNGLAATLARINAAIAGCGNTQQPSPRPSGVMRYQRSTSTT